MAPTGRRVGQADMKKAFKTLGILAILGAVCVLLSIPLCGVSFKGGSQSAAWASAGVYLFFGGLILLALLAVVAIILGVIDALRPNRQAPPSPYYVQTPPSPPPPPRDPEDHQ